MSTEAKSAGASVDYVGQITGQKPVINASQEVDCGVQSRQGHGICIWRQHTGETAIRQRSPFSGCGRVPDGRLGPGNRQCHLRCHGRATARASLGPAGSENELRLILLSRIQQYRVVLGLLVHHQDVHFLIAVEVARSNAGRVQPNLKILRLLKGSVAVAQK